MRRLSVLAIVTLGFCPLLCSGQETPNNSPDTPAAPAATTTSNPRYTPPTQSERFKTYLRQTYGVWSILEAGARAGINQALDRPSQWQEGAEGYAERFGSAMGLIAVRGTTEYVLSAAFKEDLRFRPCRGCSVGSKFAAALADTFTARKGDDGHRAFSVARLVGPVSGSLVATNTWEPAGHGRAETVKGVGLTFGLVFFRNVIKEMASR
jgi:hypothetical protein